MLFKDSFTKMLEEIRPLIAATERLVQNAEASENPGSLAKINKNLSAASKLLTSLYSEVAKQGAEWDETTLKQRKGEYNNLVTRFKSIQQEVDSLKMGQNFNPRP
jgi:asparagine synthetase A